MTQTVGAYEAKTHLPKLLERVARGEHIIITKHGVPVAVLRSIDPRVVVDVSQLITDIKAFRSKLPSAGPTVREMIEAGRR